MPARVLLMDVGEGVSGEVEIEVSRIISSEIESGPHLDAVPLARRALTRAEVQVRNSLAGAVRRAQEGYHGASFLVGDAEHDAAGLQIEMHVDRLARWDFEIIVVPILEHLRSAGSGAQSTIVLYPGSSLLDGFSLRWALRFGSLMGATPRDLLSNLVCLPIWTPSAELFLPLVDRIARTESLPQVELSRTTLLLAPEPPGWLPRLLAVRDHSEWPDILDAMTPEIRLAMIGAELRREVEELAAASGVDVVGHVTTERLLAGLRAPGPGHTLILVAHQDDDAVHLADGRLSLAEARSALRQLRERGDPCHDTVDLAVCGASEPRNLAECFQASGSCVVLTRGRYAYYGRTLAALLTALRLLARAGPLPLPVLVDRVWWDTLNAARAPRL